MAKIWRNRIIAETRTYAEVPLTWKAQVKELLKADVESGVISIEKYEQYVGELYKGSEV